MRKLPASRTLYSISKYRLPDQWSKGSQADTQAQPRSKSELGRRSHQQRRDLTDLEFVSIDAAKTQDIDDALYAEISDDGWTLFVAIADPTPSMSTPASNLHQ